MILWAKRAATVLSGIFLMALLFPAGSLRAGMAGGILNFTWALAEKLPLRGQRFLSPWVLIINTILLTYGVFSGGPAAFCSSGGRGIPYFVECGAFFPALAGRPPGYPISLYPASRRNDSPGVGGRTVCPGFSGSHRLPVRRRSFIDVDRGNPLYAFSRRSLLERKRS